MSKLTTILLLGVLICIAYCLMKPSTEKFTNEGVVNNTPLVLQAPVKPVSVQSVDNTMYSQALPEINDDMLNQIISEREAPIMASHPEKTAMSQFEANDEDIISGASLDAAFDKPIPESVNSDVVDLQRNNVKNYNTKDFLPKEINDDWFNTDFSQAKYKMNDDKLINTERYVIGVNTTSGSLRNPTWDIRGNSYPIPKFSVSPWNNSTIEPDYNIKSLC
jgi:hypothetical protein